MSSSVRGHPPFITNRECLHQWQEYWRPSEFVTKDLPADAIFSLVPITSGAREIVLGNTEHAINILHDGKVLIGLAVRLPRSGANDLLMSIGRGPSNMIKIPNVPEIAREHVRVEQNLETNIPLIRNLSVKGYVFLGIEGISTEGTAIVKSSTRFDRDIHRTAVLPQINTVLAFGPEGRAPIAWRMYWHVTSWPLRKYEMSRPPDRTLAATTSFEDLADVLDEKAKLRDAPQKPRKLHMKVCELGRSGYGSLYKAVNLTNGDLVAIKTQLVESEMKAKIRRDRMDTSAQREYVRDLRKKFENELAAYGRFKHRNIAKFHGWWDFGNRVEIYLALKDGSAMDLVTRRGLGEIEKLEIVFDVLKDTASALEYMHRNGFVHRDLRPNVISYETFAGSQSGYRFSLTDMTFCLPVDWDLKSGKAWNVAPELWRNFRSRYYPGERSDVWSLFITIADLLHPACFSRLDRCRDGHDIVQEVDKVKAGLRQFEDFRAMAAIDPGKRPSARQIVELTQKADVRSRFCSDNPDGRRPRW